MTYNLYIDVVFFINLTMDIIVLMTVRKLLKVKTSRAKIILSGCIGALWACIITIYPILPVFLEVLITYVGIGGLMVKVGLNTKGARQLIKGILGLYLSAITLGGAMYALYQYTNTGYYVELFIRGNAMAGLPLIIFILLVAGACLGTRYLWINIFEIRRQKQNISEVILIKGESKVKVIGFWDTGNHLHEPITGKPVHVVSKAVWNQFYKKDDPALIIPFHTIGTEEGIMMGIIIDSIEIYGEQEKKIMMKPLIAVSPHPLTRDGSYEILLHVDN